MPSGVNVPSNMLVFYLAWVNMPSTPQSKSTSTHTHRKDHRSKDHRYKDHCSIDHCYKDHRSEYQKLINTDRYAVLLLVWVRGEADKIPPVGEVQEVGT